MPPVGFEPAVPRSEWTQTYALDRAATGIGGQLLESLNKYVSKLVLYN
jgi:hypothetical protein